MKSFLKYWLPLLFWLVVIFINSTNLMSAEHTSRFIVPFVRWLKPDISPETVTSIHFMIRKFAHLSEYAMLALLLLRASIRMSNIKSKPILYASVWVGCFVVALSDEFHQTFVASRSASIVDVMIDSVGAILGLLLGVVLVRRRSKQLRKVTAGS